MKKQLNLPILAENAWTHYPYLGIGELAVRGGIHPGLVYRFVRMGLVDPVNSRVAPEQWLFERETVPLVAKILRLRNELGINYSGVGVVLELLERINALENRIRRLEGDLI